MKHLVIGIGEVGSAIWANLSKADYDVTPLDKGEPLEGMFDVLHICIPYSKSFTRQVRDYQKRFEATYTIVYSSVPIGTTKKLHNAVHTPVEGVHPRLEYSVKVGKRWIGFNDPQTSAVAEKIWSKITKVELVENSDFTEFLKLASTSKYGLNIAWAHYMEDVAWQLGMKYDLVKTWDADYNRLYTKLHLPKYRKYVLDPPGEKIGGHCIIPNAILLDEQYPDEFLKILKDFQ